MPTESPAGEEAGGAEGMEENEHCCQNETDGGNGKAEAFGSMKQRSLKKAGVAFFWISAFFFTKKIDIITCKSP